MDIHRCRFVPYPASPINALVFSHTSNPEKSSSQSLRLALGRANGNIEIWNPADGAWAQESVLYGGKNRSIEGLVWTQNLDTITEAGTAPGQHRLFSIGSSNAVTEWDLATGMPLGHASGGNAETWSITVQPRWRREDGVKNKSNQLIALGYADGSIVLLSTDDEELNYSRTLRRPGNKKARVLSLTFCDRNTIAAGYSDGTVWVYDVRGKVKTVMHLGSGPTKAATYVWTLKCLPDNTLVTGDSTGELRFWDLTTFTLTQRLLCHDADILAISPSYDGSILFSGGMDRKVCVIAKDKQTKRWRAIHHQRMHAGHVKVMASIETRKLNVVVSGGVDASLVVSPLKLFGSENTRTLPALPQSPPLISAPAARMLISWWDREIAFCGMNKENLSLASIPKSSSKSEEADPLQRILVQGEENITCVSVTRNARYIAVATSTGCKIFMLSDRKEDSSLKRVQKLNSVSLAKQGASIVSFSPDGRWLLLVTPKNELILYSIPLDANGQLDCNNLENSIVLRRIASVTDPKSTLGMYIHNIARVAWSADSRMLACADISGHISAWTCSAAQTNGISKPNGHTKDGGTASDESDESEDEDLVASSAVNGFVWHTVRSRIPKVSSLPLILSFRPDGTITKHLQNHAESSTISNDRLLVVTLHHEILEFHALTGRLTEWSKRNPKSRLPQAFGRIRDRTMGNLWDVSGEKQRLWLYGTSFLFMLDMSRDMVKDPTQKNLKRKRSTYDSNVKQAVDHKGSSGAGATIANPSDYGLIIENDQATGDDSAEDSDADDDEEGQAEIWPDLDEASTAYHRKSRGSPSKMAKSSSSEGKGANGLKPNANGDGSSADDRRELAFWSTFKYRPILGMAIMESEVRETALDEEQNMATIPQLEVALVERPLWDQDLDLPFLT